MKPNSSNRSEEFSMQLIGASKSGKNTLLSEKYFKLINFKYGPCGEKKDVIENCSLCIYEPAGHSASIHALKMVKRNGIIVTFDVGDPNNIEKTEPFLKAAKKDLVGAERPLILLGTKCDLPRQISYSEAEAFAKQWGASYMEISAQENVNVEKTLQRIASLAKNPKHRIYCSYEDNKDIPKVDLAKLSPDIMDDDELNTLTLRNQGFFNNRNYTNDDKYDKTNYNQMIDLTILN